MNTLDIEIKHDIDLQTFGFVIREKENAKAVIYRCGRDFVYYALNFYFPDKYNPIYNSAYELEHNKIFGFKLPWYLMWTLLQFTKMPRLLKKEGLLLRVNERPIYSWFSLILGFLIPNRPTYEEVILAIENAVSNQEVIGIDVSLKIGGLVDHIMFVYGSDKENIYVFDTNQVPGLEYKKVTSDDRFIMKLPKTELRKRLGLFSRIWKITKISNFHWSIQKTL